MKAAIVAALAIASAAFGARADDEFDFTADIRAKVAAGECSKPDIGIVGTPHASYPQDRIFDGKIDTNGRFLAAKVPIEVTYEIPSDYEKYGTLQMTRYVVHQLTGGSSQNDSRCMSEWKLYAYVGTEWVEIDHQSGIYFKNNASASVDITKTFEIDPEKQVVADKYKLEMLKNGGSLDSWSIGIGEVDFIGVVGRDPYLNIGTVANNSGTLAATIGTKGLPAPAKLMVVFGQNDRGTDLANWNCCQKVADLAAGDTAAVTYDVPNAGLLPAVRFAVVGEATETTAAFVEFSDLLTFSTTGGGDDREKVTLTAEGERPIPATEQVLFTNADISKLQNVIIHTRFKYSTGNEKGEGTFRSDEDPWTEEEHGNQAKSGIYNFTRSEDGQTVSFEFRGLDNWNNTTYNGLVSSFKWQLWQDGDDIKGKLVWFKAGGDARKFMDLESWDTGVGLRYDFGFHLNTQSDNYTVFFDDLQAEFLGMGPFYVIFLDSNEQPVGNPQIIAAAQSATAPTPEAIDGYQFMGWDKDFSSVTCDMTVRPIYRKICHVTFLDADGSTLKEDTLLEGDTIEPPDMAGRTYQDREFQGWDAEFDKATDDLTINAVYADRQVALVETPVCYAGLLQGKLNAANDFKTDFIANSVIDVELVPGTVMAEVKTDEANCGTVGYTNPYTGTTFLWNKSGTTYGYLGQIWLNAGDKLNIAKNVDDSAFVKIDGTEVLNHTTYSAYPVASYTATFTGWHDFEVRVGDGSGGKGPSSGAIAPLGLAYNINGTTTQSATGWSPFYNETGLFLRVAKADASYLLLGTTRFNAGDLTVELGAQALPCPAKLVAVYGATDCGDDPAAWSHVIELASLPAGDTAARAYVVNGLGNNAAVRFALIGEATATAPAFHQATALKSYVQTSPLAAIAIGEIGEGNTDNVPVIVNLEAFGADATEVSVTLEYSTTPTFEAAESFDVPEPQNALGTLTLTLPDLTMASGYYVRAVVSNGTRSFTTEAQRFETFNPYVAHVGDTLTWTGGTVGTWDATSKNWALDIGGVTYSVVWVDGCVAKFAEAVTVTVSGEKSVAGFEIAGDVVLTGDALTMVAPATVIYNANASLRIENDVKGTDGLTTRIREKHDVFVPAQWYRSVFAEDEDIRSQKEETVFFENVKLEDVTAIGGLLEVKFGNAAAVKYEIDSDNPQKDAGVFYYQNDGTTLTAQFQGKSYSSYDGVYHCVKVELTQDGENVKGKIAYVRSATCTYGGQDAGKSRWGKGWKLGDNCDESVCVNDAYTTHFYDLVIGSASYTIYDELPTEMATTFTGDYGISGGLTINNGTVTIDGTYAVKQPVAIATGSSLVFGPNADVELTNDGSSDSTNVFNASATGAKGEIDIYGTVRVYKSASSGPYNMFGTRTALNVRDGGELVLDTSTYSDYGFAGVRINCYEGGIVRLTAGSTLGVNNNEVFLYGGTMTNECDATKNEFLLEATLSDGAVVSGSRYYIGFYSAYVGTSGNITMIAATGTKPSYINAETLTFGNKNGKPTSTSNDEIAEFNIEDVTGDAESDLIINSQIVKNGTPVLTVADGATADNRLFHAIVKKGAGTLELNNAIDMVGAVKMQEGTLRLGAKASGTLGAIVVTGNSTLDIAEGATMAFDDSTALAWTEGATLNLTGDISGLTFTGLTDAQLAAITINGKASKVRLDSEGHLKMPGFRMIIR